ncbi:MAG: hypothetical protein KGJ66_14255 [Alphaproteobacteria bacterium]|nr:hypothetical protein [Alphaproteobacteria bacterium]
MDRVVNVRMFSVEAKENGGMAFSEALRHIAAQPFGRREHEPEPDVIIRLEDLDTIGRVWTGEMVRVQEANLPPKALRGQRRERLGVRSIGHSSAFVFDTHLSILALQLSRNRITASRMALYAEALAGGDGYNALPVPDRETWNVLRRGGVRALAFSLATPSELAAIDDETRSVRRGMMAMKESMQPTRLELVMTMGRGEVDMNRGKAVSLLQWLLRERQAHRGGVTRMMARVIPRDGEDAEALNLISGHMGDREWVDLPEDDPDTSYQRRREYILRVLRENRAALEGMFGG